MEEQHPALIAMFHVSSQVQKSLLAERLKDPGTRTNASGAKPLHVDNREAEAGRVLMEIEFKARRDQGRQDFRSDSKVEKENGLPPRRQERLARQSQELRASGFGIGH